MAGYQDTSSHLDGDIIFAQDDKAQFALISAGFDKTTGHTHGGGDGEGTLVPKIGLGAKVLQIDTNGVTGTQLNLDLTVATSPTDVKVPSDAAVEAEIDRLEAEAVTEATRVDDAADLETIRVDESIATKVAQGFTPVSTTSTLAVGSKSVITATSTQTIPVAGNEGDEIVVTWEDGVVMTLDSVSNISVIAGATVTDTNWVFTKFIAVLTLVDTGTKWEIK